MSAQSEPPRPPKTVARRLAQFYSRNGYMRTQNEHRIAAEGSNVYKKGEEIRLIASSEDELREMRELLERAGFKLGKPFAKGAQLCQPVYGRAAVARFLEMVEEHAS